MLLRTEEFICLRPPMSLSAYISNINITFPTKNIMSDSFTAIPCGCASLAVEMDRSRSFAKLEGPATKPVVVGSRANELDMLVTIEFRPAGLYALTGISQSELVDESIPFAAVDSRLSKLLCEVVEKSGSAEALVAGLDVLLLRNMDAGSNPQLQAALGHIIGSAGSTAVKDLSGDVYYSERHLNRIFKRYVGVSAKSLSRIVRINNAFRLLKKPSASVAIVSDLLGFHDRSHFIRDFRAVSGITPQEFRSNMSDFYINPTKF